MKIEQFEKLSEEIQARIKNPSFDYKMVGSVIKSEELPKDNFPSMFEEAGLKFQDGDDERVIKNRASNGDVDRDGDILNPEGWLLKDFKSNPILLFNHDFFSPAVGAVIKVWKQERTDLKSMKAEDNDEEDEELITDDHLKSELLSFSFFDRSKLGDELLVKYQVGVMRAFSVRFDPKRIKTVTEEERQQLGMGRFGIFFEKQALLELSAVTIPANKEALVLAKQSRFGSLSDEHLNKFAKILDTRLEAMCKTVDELRTVVERNQLFDDIEKQLKNFVNSGQPTRADELYGDPLDTSLLEDLVKKTTEINEQLIKSKS